MILNDQCGGLLDTEHSNNIRAYREKLATRQQHQQNTNQRQQQAGSSVGTSVGAGGGNKHIKILKSYYQKDALASVAKSFLNIDQRYTAATDITASTTNSTVGTTGQRPSLVVNGKLGNKKELSKLSIGAISVATTATSSSDLAINNHHHTSNNISPPPSSDNNSSSQSYVSSSSNKYNDTNNINARTSYDFDDEQNNINSTGGSHHHQVASSSCTLFVNKLVTEKIQRLNSLGESSSINSRHGGGSGETTETRNEIESGQREDQVDSTTTNNKMYHQQEQYYRQQQQALYQQQQQQQQAQYYPAYVTEKRQLYLLSKKLRKFLPFNYGLKNHGNTCFMNCVLQSLFHTSPLCEYFVTETHENDIKVAQGDYERQRMTYINNSRSINSHRSIGTSGGPPSFVLTRHFHRLLLSMWQNSYESVYSVQIKNLIGELNPTFAGVNQNDSHEFCVWLLDRLSQELSYKIEVERPRSSRQPPDDGSTESEPSPSQPDVTDSKSSVEIVSKSFIEDLFKVEFKSTVICSKCKYKSTKCETDMMLSLPLPQHHQSNGYNNNNKPTPLPPPPPIKKYQRRSLYANIIFTNQMTVRNFLPSAQFVAENFAVSNGMMLMPLNVKIAFNVHMTTEDAYPERELVRLSDASTNNTVINPAFADLRHYLSSMYMLDESRLVFVDMAETMDDLVDEASVRERLVKSSRKNRPNVESSDQELFVVELNSQQAAPGEQEMLPLINLIAFNVYHKQTTRSERGVACNFGVPFVVLTNRDCSYSELCAKLLETQAKYFKDRNILKYKEQVVKLFSISLIDTETKQWVRIDPNDELPLYAQCVDKALAQSHRISSSSGGAGRLLEHVKVNIEWRSYEDISNFFADLNSPRIDFTHKTVHVLRTLDESDEKPIVAHVQPPGVTNNSSSQFYTSTVTPSSSSSDPMQVSLSDCFELFTQTEELSDENSWKCSKCKQQTNAYKNLSISVAPPILIIHLKRFFYKSNTSNFKLTTPVSFPVSNLDIGKYVSNNGGNTSRTSRSDNNRGGSTSIIYDLFAVCNHKGQNMANGHYTAFCKNPVDSRWYCFDDSQCSPLVDAPTNGIFNTGFNQVCTENAYILFYKKRGCMTNDHWWVNYVDRYLFNSQEFQEYFQDLALIERRQQQYESDVPTSNNKTSDMMAAGGQSALTIKKPSTSLRSSIKNKLLGKSTTTNSEMSSSYDQTDNSEFYYHQQRESSRPRPSHQQQQPQYQTFGGGNLIDMNDHQQQQRTTGVNYYDENNRPKRIQQKQQSSNSSSLTSTNSTNNSTPSHHHHHRTGVVSSYRPLECAMPQQQQHYVNGYSGGHQRIDGITSGFNEMKLSSPAHSPNSATAASGDLMLLNYPSDNEILFQRNKQRVLDSYTNNSVMNGTNGTVFHHYGPPSANNNFTSRNYHHQFVSNGHAAVNGINNVTRATSAGGGIRSNGVSSSSNPQPNSQRSQYSNIETNI